MEKTTKEKLKKMVDAKQDLNACIALYQQLYQDSGISSRDELEEEAEALRHGGDAEGMEATRIEILLKDHPERGYFIRFIDEPITFKWLRDRLGMGPDPRKAANLLTFLQNGNVIRIRDASEYAAFIRLMATHGLGSLLAPRKALYEDVIKLYKLPQNVFKHPGWDGKTLYAECQNGKESIGIYPYTVRATVEWYGVEPMSVDDVDEEK